MVLSSFGLSLPADNALLEQRSACPLKIYPPCIDAIRSTASLFANPVMKYILLSSGNIPVDRKSKDRQKLFRGTFDTLAKGEAVGLFPEGTSYTEPRIMQVKDGAAWAALEYTKWARENPDKVKSSAPVMIVPAAIVYTNKSKYRSDVIME